MRSLFFSAVLLFTVLIVNAPVVRAATPVTANELDFWVRAGRGTNEILGDVAQRGLLEPLDADAQQKLRSDGAEAALLSKLSGGAYVVSGAAAAKARAELAGRAERDQEDRQRAADQRQLAARAQNPSAQPSAAPGARDAANPPNEGPIEMEAIAEPVGSGGDGWRVGFLNARKDAAEQNKMMLVDFTGSDWSDPCKKLEREVFKTQEFQSYASEKLILVRADYPQHHVLPADVKTQNDELKEGFKVTGFPTVLVLNSKGHVVGKLRYLEGGPMPFIAELQKLEKK